MTRCTPEAVSIPRLQLMAAIVGLKLCEKGGGVLRIESHCWTFWSDSMELEIQALTNPDQWTHVSSGLNSADLLIRVLSVAEVVVWTIIPEARSNSVA